MDPQSEADKIRLKRLERLQAAQAVQRDAQTSVSSSATNPTEDKSIVSSNVSSIAVAAKTDTPAKSPLKALVSSANKISTSPAANTNDCVIIGEDKVKSVPRPSNPSSSITNATRSTATTGTANEAALRIPYPQWLSAVISRIFAITLSVQRAESSNWSITYLYTLRDELAAEERESRSDASTISTPVGTNLRFDEDNLDRAIVARLSMDAAQLAGEEDVEMEDDSDVEVDRTDPAVRMTVLAALPQDTTNLEYLVGCWKRWPSERAKLGNAKASEEETVRRVRALEVVRRKILENIGLQLQEPDLFPQPSGKILGGSELLPSLVQSSAVQPMPQMALDSHQTIQLLADLTSVYSSPQSSSELVDIVGGPILQPLIDRLGAKQRGMQYLLAAMGAPTQQAQQGILDLTTMEWRTIARAVNEIAENRAIANMFAEMPNWCPISAPAHTFEMEALLGPLLRLGTFADAFPQVGKAYFAKPSELSREAVEASSNALRSTLSALQSLLFKIVNAIVRSSPSSREAVLSLFSHILKLNMKRDGMRVDRRTVSSDGFMINNFSVLMDLAAPFMDLGFSKIDKIDAEYFKKSRGRIDINDVTKIHATADEAREYYGTYGVDVGSAPPPNFISEIFFLACAYSHYGLVPTYTYHESVNRHVDNLRRDLQEMENDRQYDGTTQEATFKHQIERQKAELEAWRSRIHAAEVQILDPGFIQRVSTYTNFVMTWLVRLVDPKGTHPSREISLDSLPERTPLAFSMLPEYIVEDVTEFYLFVSRFAPQTMFDLQKDQLVTFVIVFLSTPYINNPYLKGKFVEILYRNTRSWGPRHPRGAMGDVLNFNPLALRRLLPALMRIYCEIEFTGTHNQFYEKFETRHYISKILKMIWETKDHRDAFRVEAGKEEFVRFVNYLLNDTTFFLDESLSKLIVIRDIQQEMANKETWNTQSDEQRKDRERELRSAEGQCTSFLQNTYEALHLLKTLTAEAPDPFLKGEIVDRLAAALDYNLNTLAGPQCQELKVADREKYHFRPRDLLGDILQVIMNLANREAYVAATARDGRSYSKTLFESAIRIAVRNAVKSEQQLHVLRALIQRVEAIKLAEAEEEEMGETPDEYLDPLTAEIMADPVTLPASGINIDFNTIKQHLLTVQQDPFNRTPLKIEDVVRNDSLRQEIEAFREKRKHERLSKATASSP